MTTRLVGFPGYFCLRKLKKVTQPTSEPLHGFYLLMPSIMLYIFPHWEPCLVSDAYVKSIRNRVEAREYHSVLNSWQLPETENAFG